MPRGFHTNYLSACPGKPILSVTTLSQVFVCFYTHRNNSSENKSESIPNIRSSRPQTIREPSKLSITSQLGRSGETGVLNGRHIILDLIKMTY